jgi:hypothetical protein
MKPNAEKIQNTNPKHLVWKFRIFEHLDLFRISSFELGLFPFTLGENQVRLYSQIDGAVDSSKQLTNTVEFLQQQYGYASAYVPKESNRAQ